MTIDQLWSLALILAFGAASLLIPLFIAVDHHNRLRPALLLWTTASVMAIVFSAACAVLAGIKGAEERIIRRLNRRPGSQASIASGSTS